MRQIAYEQKQGQLVALGRQLDTLLELRLKDVIDDEQYAHKRSELSLARDTLHQDIEGLEQQGDQTRETLLNVLLFCANARAWFASGDADVRRLIANALGASYELQGNLVKVEPHPVLIPILQANWSAEEMDFQVGSEATNTHIEPVESGSGNWKTGDLEGVKVSWGRIWGQVRTAIQHQPRLASSSYCRFRAQLSTLISHQQPDPSTLPNY